MKSAVPYVLILLLCSPIVAYAVPVQEEADGEKLPVVSAVGLDQGERLRVLATTAIVGDVVHHVGGEAITLTVLIEPGQDPHGYEPTPRALVAVVDAHLVLTNGGGLEESLLDLVYANAGGTVVSVSAGLQGGPDPHYWTDPGNVMVWVANIAKILAVADPARRETYEKNAHRYLTRLRDLDAAIRVQIDQVPPERRLLITDHDMFGYYADAYGLRVVGTILPGDTTTSGSSAARATRLVGLLQDESVRAIFVGHSAGRAVDGLAAAIARELGGEVSVIRLLTGSLAPRGQPGDSYIGYMEYNTDRIVAGLTTGAIESGE